MFCILKIFIINTEFHLLLDLNAEIVVFAFWGRGQISSRKQTSYAKKMGEAIYSVKRKKKGSGSKDNCVF